MGIVEIHRQLIYSLEPRPGKFSGESVIPKQHVGHTLTFTSGKPSSDKGMNRSEVGLNQQRPAGDHHDYALNAAAYVRDGGGTWFGNR